VEITSPGSKERVSENGETCETSETGETKIRRQAAADRRQENDIL
jgi:hypothetical protein